MTIRAMLPLVGIACSYAVRTYRQKDRGDTIFLETLVGEERVIRIAVPPAVADAIARQRDSLTTEVGSKIATQAAADRIARGEQPAFLWKASYERQDYHPRREQAERGPLEGQDAGRAQAHVTRIAMPRHAKRCFCGANSMWNVTNR